MNIQELILNDFITEGFPISRKSPVLCTKDTGEVAVAYNRYMLHCYLASTKKCLGVWPGKKYTGVFNLSVEDYKKMPYPPEEHQDIDSAEQIAVHLDGGKFDHLIYTPGPQEPDRTPVMCKDIKLFEYVKAVSLRHQIIP